MISRKTFYQYQSVNKHTLSNLSKNILYFNHPTKFNDPFDSKIYVDCQGKEEQWISLICNRDGCTPDEAKIKMKEFNKWDDGLVSPQEHECTELIKVPRVCCFSGKKDSILMWSHYADHHKGICLCFRAAKNFDYFIPLRKPNSEAPIYYGYAGVFSKVIYCRDSIPKISSFDNQSYIEKKISEQLLTKFKDWRYETEYRIIHPEYREYLNNPLQSRKLLEYYPGSLKGIIFGCKINQNNAKKVYEAINKNNLSEISNKRIIRYYKAEEDKDKCKVNISPITDITEFINNCPVN